MTAHIRRDVTVPSGENARARIENIHSFDYITECST